MDSDSEVGWGACRLGHTFGDKLYFTRGIPEEKWIPKKLEAPTVAKPAPKPAPKRGKEPTAKLQPVCPSLSLMGKMCSCSRLCERKFYTVPVQKKGQAEN